MNQAFVYAASSISGRRVTWTRFQAWTGAWCRDPVESRLAAIRPGDRDGKSFRSAMDRTTVQKDSCLFWWISQTQRRGWPRRNTCRLSLLL